MAERLPDRNRGVECIRDNETLVEAARRMRDLDAGSMPIRGEDDRLEGMLTDRDIVVGRPAKEVTRPRPGRATSRRVGR